MLYLSANNLIKLLESLQPQYETYVPTKRNNQLFYKKYEGDADDIVIGEVRPFEPLKSFFTPAREIVAENFSREIPSENKKPFCIVGVKACDLKGLKISDYVFKNHDYPDPFYLKLRQENLIISADCTSTVETCFCTAVGLKPHPQEDFDINLSPVKGGFIAKTGSEKGKELVEQHAKLFTKPTPDMAGQRQEQRDHITKEVEKNIKVNALPRQDKYKNIINKGYDSNIWTDEAATCVECGACNTICPTCHCFLLYDQKNEDKLARMRIWDSCMIKDFARVAGGANPRPKLAMRLRNRFEKKFDFFPKVAQVYACTGCGRCIKACPAKIDIRDVLKKLVDYAQTK